MKTIIVGLLLVLVSIGGAIAAGADGLSFINIPSIGIIVIIAGGLTLIRYRKGESRVNVLASLKKYCLLSGVIGCMIGMLQMSFSMHPETPISGWGIGFGTCLLTVFYGLVLYCIIDAIQFKKG